MSDEPAAPGDVERLWARFRAVTPARIGLGRSGDALPTARQLEIESACAAARDAVAARADFVALAAALAPLASIEVHSAAADRETYLRRPDLGRRLDNDGVRRLPGGPFDAVFVVADGLSAGAVQTHAAPLIESLLPLLQDWRLGPVILAAQARVAIGDEIGAAMRAEMVVVLIGERPGLSVPDSLGVYLTYAPRAGRLDAERNCISNIHRRGVDYRTAARTLEWLMARARTLRLTGVDLKEDAPPASPRIA